MTVDRSFYIRLSAVLVAVVVLLPLMLYFFLPGEIAASATVNPSPELEKSEPMTGILNPDCEVRGVWIATVSNINFPSKPGLSAEKQKAELDDIIEYAKATGINAVYFQVRPCADALYKSDIFPTSKFLSGEQGAPLEFDCLAYLLEQAHHNKMLVHAWVNPLRVTSGNKAYPATDVNALSPTNPARINPELTVEYADGKLYFNAGLPQVQDLVVAGVEEIVERYDVDGIIFDDYFYPYPTTVENLDGTTSPAVFDDDEAYEKYGGDYDTKDDFRRASINKIIEDCYRVIKEVDDECLFGISPFGIWQNDDGKNGGSATRGLSAYSAIYADALAWVQGGYVDYIAPQLYWTSENPAAEYDILADWWNKKLDGSGVDLLIAHGVYQYTSSDWQGELTQQIDYARSLLTYRGGIMYGYAALRANDKGVDSELCAAYENEIIYSDSISSGEPLSLSSPTANVTDDTSALIEGTSDPTMPVFYRNEKVSRRKDGSFTLSVPLAVGENVITLTCGEQRKTVTITREE